MKGAPLTVLLALTMSLPCPSWAQSNSGGSTLCANAIDHNRSVPDLAALSTRSESELAGVVLRYTDDRTALGRRWDVEHSSTRRERFREFYQEWANSLDAVDFDALSLEGRIDYVLMANELRYEIESLDREEALFREMVPLMPFAETLIELQEARRRMEIPDPQATASLLAELPHRIASAQEALQESLQGEEPASRIVAFRTAAALDWMCSPKALSSVS